jgi:hypothetical protein
MYLHVLYPLPQPSSRPFDSQLFTNTPGSHLGLTYFVARRQCRQCRQSSNMQLYLSLHTRRVKHEKNMKHYHIHTYDIRSHEKSHRHQIETWHTGRRRGRRIHPQFFDHKLQFQVTLQWEEKRGACVGRNGREARFWSVRDINNTVKFALRSLSRNLLPCQDSAINVKRLHGEWRLFIRFFFFTASGGVQG